MGGEHNVGQMIPIGKGDRDDVRRTAGRVGAGTRNGQSRHAGRSACASATARTDDRSGDGPDVRAADVVPLFHGHSEYAPRTVSVHAVEHPAADARRAIPLRDHRLRCGDSVDRSSAGRRKPRHHPAGRIGRFAIFSNRLRINENDRCDRGRRSQRSSGFVVAGRFAVTVISDRDRSWNRSSDLTHSFQEAEDSTARRSGHRG